MKKSTQAMSAKNISLGGVLSGGAQFRVLQSQRRYAWKKEQIMQFVDDVKYAYYTVGSDPTFQYFFGPMAFIRDGNKHVVVDGQQRLATIGIFIGVIRDIMQERGVKNNMAVCYLQHKRGGEMEGRIVLGRRNKDFYENFIIKPDIAKNRNAVLENREYNKKKDPNYWLAFAYREFYKELKTMIRGNIEICFKLLDVISNTCTVIKIDVNTNEFAYRIFETLNARGMPLAESDLIKNFILENCMAQLQHNYDTKWEDMIKRVEPENLSTYIRYFWIANHGIISKRELYKKTVEYLNKKTSKKRIDEYVNDLHMQSETFAALQNPQQDKEFWQNDQELVEDLSMLNKMNSEVVRIVLLIGKVKCRKNHKVYKQLARTLLLFFFRSKIIGGTHASLLEQELGKIAKEIRGSKKLNLPTINKMLKSKDIYPSDNVFKQRFVEKNFNQKTGKYVLEQIENHNRKKSDKWPISTITIEHIMPKKQSRCWKHIKNEDHDDLLWSIGNLTLLSKEDNRVASSHSFKTKKDVYAESDIKITKSLKHYTDWDEKEIRRRSRQFSDVAVKIWRV